jgi:N-alpha-acetyltransferase 38, NatC auxiliary subunit
MLASTGVQSIEMLRSLLQESLRISVTDGRTFIGTFVGTDKAMNILMINTEEFRPDLAGVSGGRFVGQVLVPWKLVQKIEIRGGDSSLGDEQEDGLYS